MYPGCTRAPSNTRLELAAPGGQGRIPFVRNISRRRRAFYMLYVYAKNEQGDLTPAQVKTLRRAVQEEFR